MVSRLDIGMKEGKGEGGLGGGGMDRIEEVGGSLVGNDGVWGEKIMYWGGMGWVRGK